MPRISKLISSFNGGEVSPEFEGRTDQDKYKTSVKRLENFIVHPEGGIHRRPGTRFITEVRDSSKRTRLIPFIFSTLQAYVLEFSEFKIRVFADDKRIDVVTQSTKTVGFVVDSNTDQIEIIDHGYNHNQGPVRITATGAIPGGLALDTDYWILLPTTTVFVDADVDVATEIITAPSAHGYSDNEGPFRLTTTGALPEGLSGNVDYFIDLVSATEFKLLDSLGAPVLLGPALRLGTHTLATTSSIRRNRFKLSATQGGVAINITTNGTPPHEFTPNALGLPPGLILEIDTPYKESELDELHFVQSADFLFIDHKDHRPAQLTRRGNTKWRFDSVNVFGGPFLPENINDLAKIAVSASTLPNTDITVTLSGPIVINEGAGWQSRDIGRLLRLKITTSDWGHVEITGIHETGTGVNTVARATIREKLGGTTATEKWRFGSWFSNNYPKTLSFSEQRLWHAGEPDTPQTLHGSKTALFADFTPTEPDGEVLATNAIDFVIGANQVNAILWLGTERQLFAGTPASVFIARASLDSEAIVPDNINLPQITAIGSSNVQPVNIADNLVYMTRNSQGLRGLQSIPDSDRFAPIDITLLAKHIFGRTKKITAMAFQFDRQQVLWLVRDDGVLIAVTYVPDQQVFAWHRHFIGGSFGSGEAIVESIVVIPSKDGTYDQLWMIVKRTIDGATVRNIEFMEDEWLDGITTNMRFMDSSPAAFSGAPSSVIGGLGHLEGETVQVLADGATHPDQVVTGGEITLDGLFSDVRVGLKYVSEMETLRLDLADKEGSFTGKVARIDHLVLRLYQSLGGEVGSNTTELDPLLFRTSGNPMDAPPPVFTGDKKITFRGGFEREKVIIVRQNQPLPMNVLAINAFISTGAR